MITGPYSLNRWAGGATNVLRSLQNFASNLHPLPRRGVPANWYLRPGRFCSRTRCLRQTWGRVGSWAFARLFSGTECDVNRNLGSRIPPRRRRTAAALHTFLGGVETARKATVLSRCPWWNSSRCANPTYKASWFLCYWSRTVQAFSALHQRNLEISVVQNFDPLHAFSRKPTPPFSSISCLDSSLVGGSSGDPACFPSNTFVTTARLHHLATVAAASFGEPTTSLIWAADH